MRKAFTLVAALLCVSVQLFAQFNSCSEWTWMKGGPGASDAYYGSKGVGSSTNRPGARDGSVSWKDSNGRLWFYGGGGYGANTATTGYLNDVWRYDPATNQWTWMQGSSAINTDAVYGSKGVASATNSPGGRSFSALWQNNDGSIWLYGGDMYSPNGYYSSSTLWKYNISTSQWTWVSGNATNGHTDPYYTALGVASAQNNPGSRSGSSTWTDANGKLWLFGGYNSIGGAYNDLWKYDPATGYWTAVQANEYYAANKPAVRYHAAEWKDSQGNLWLFGGYGTTVNGNGSFADIWKYTISSNQWILIKGDDALHPSTQYGTQGVASSTNTPGGRYASASWSDAQGFWLFGGYKEANGEGPYSDLWNYDPSTNSWTWVKGDNVPYTASVYGTKGVSAPANKPGARYLSAWWIDNAANFWIMGGFNGSNVLNDLLKLSTNSGVQTTYYQDYDKDGYGSASVSKLACSQPSGYVSNNSDCNDRNNTIYPNAPELCDGLDNDCDGVVDDGLTKKTFYKDYDKDGYGTSATTIQACAAPPGYVSSAGDCNDKNKAINPGAAEICNGVDDNCDGIIDNGVTTTTSSSQWTWVKGGPGATDPVYGTKGVGSTSNRPGARDGSVSWKDPSGKLWMFGGGGYGLSNASTGYLSDVWRFDPSANQWAWMQGANTINASPNYGTKGTPANTNSPGGRSFSADWQNTDGSVWLYGGANATSGGYYASSDLWKYNISTNQWTWLGGNTTNGYVSPYYTALGVAAAQNNPGSRAGSSTWIDNSGKLWLFGGFDGIGGAYNDLWKYDPVTGYWTAVQANEYYAIDKPAVRYHAAEWKDSQGNLWIFGGYGTTVNGNGSFADIWKYSISTNKWTLVKGDATLFPASQYGTQGMALPSNTPGGRYASASWSDSKYFWFYGGTKEANGEGPYSDLWKYDPSVNSWTWVKGDNVPYAASVYGTKGVAAPANKPGARYNIAWWTDNAANIWIMGGYNNSTVLNDLWKLSTNSGLQTTYYQDYDKDGFGNAAVKLTTSCAAPPGYVVNNTDCNDRNAAVNPSKAEVPGNNIDDDCDGVVDEATFTNAITSRDASAKITEPALRLNVSVLPNPSSHYFTLKLESGSNKPMQLKVVDEVGRLVDGKNNITANSTLTIGQAYKPGVYYAEVVQDGKKVTVKLLKLGQF